MSVKPLDFTELCPNYSPPSSASSSSLKSILSYDDVLHYSGYSTESLISSDFRDSALSLVSLSTAVSDNIYEIPYRDHSYQSIDEEYLDYDPPNRSYEPPNRSYEPPNRSYEPPNRSYEPSALSRSRSFQNFRQSCSPQPAVSMLLSHIPTTTASCMDLREAGVNARGQRAQPHRHFTPSSTGAHSRSTTLGFDPCARPFSQPPAAHFPPPSYRESVENLLKTRLLSQSSQDPHQSMQDPLRDPLEIFANSQCLPRSNVRNAAGSVQKLAVDEFLEDRRNRFLWHQEPSEESLCRLRYPSNAGDSTNLSAAFVSRDTELTNQSAAFVSRDHEPTDGKSSPPCYQPWEDQETVSLDSGVPLTSEDNECRTPEVVAEMYNQTETLRVIDEEGRRLQLLEDVGPYMGSLNRRDKRRRPEKRDSFLFSPKRDSTVFSSANSLSSQCGLRRANTICTSGDVNAYLRNKCNRDSALSQGSETMSCKRNSKSTFDSGFESGLSDILDEILGATQYDTVMEESPKSKWASFKGKLSDTFVKSKRAEINDAMSDSSDLKMTRWTKLQQFVRFRLAKVSQHDLDMGGFEDAHWRSLEPRQFHRGTRRTQSFVKWKTPRER